jgi:hypothetical protein
MNHNNFFKIAYDRSRISSGFRPEWVYTGGDRQLDYKGATTMPIPPGVVMRSGDHINNRKLLLIGTRYGTVVVFEAYEHGASEIYLASFPEAFDPKVIRFFHADSSLSKFTLRSLVGGGDRDINIGQFLELASNEEYWKMTPIQREEAQRAKYDFGAAAA